MTAVALHEVAAPQTDGAPPPYGPRPVPRPLAPVRALEEMAASAWPALQEIYSDGWLLRFSGGFTRRSNCVLPLYPGHLQLTERVGRCEVAYARLGLPAVFKIWPDPGSAALVAALDARGYVPEANTSVMVCQLDEPPGPGGQATGIAAVEAPEWVAAYATCCPLAAEASALMNAMLRRIAPRHLLAVLRHRGRVLACGLGVCQDGYLGCFGIGTVPDQRRRGYGRSLMQQLLWWGRQQGAERAYLQVQMTNTAAAALYQQLGFVRAYEYHYRIQPAPHP